MHTFEQSFSLDVCPGVELPDHMVTLFLVFKVASILFPILPAPIYIPSNSGGGFPFLHILSSILLFVGFLMVTILSSVS